MSHLEQTKISFNNVIENQSLKGIKKYGKELDYLDEYDWLGMAGEELADGFTYLLAEQRKRTFIVNKIRRLLKYKVNDVTRTEINYWLDQLEGSN